MATNLPQVARRKRQEDEHENHERWLVSYADFITLLFAFFVVMYALSSINEGKYKVMSDSISSAFRSSIVSAGGTPIEMNPNAPAAMAIPVKRNSAAIKVDQTTAVKKDKLRTMARELNQALGPLVEQGKVKITEGAFGIVVDINASLLFAPGDARLDLVAARALIAVADILVATDFPITVEGHTDNTPISNVVFPSNWELSTVRASSVVRLFIEAGVDPRRLSAIGYADQRPVSDNATPEGRQQNRRVAITIESKTPDNAVETVVQ
jgi:chemotaxis protein MotB